MCFCVSIVMYLHYAGHPLPRGDVTGELPSPSLSSLSFLIALLAYEICEEGRSSPSFLVPLLCSHAPLDVCGVFKLGERSYNNIVGFK
jgi:hypothetical protein